MGDNFVKHILNVQFFPNILKNDCQATSLLFKTAITGSHNLPLHRTVTECS